VRSGRATRMVISGAVETEQLIDEFIDAIARERTLSRNTLDAYLSDLAVLGRHLRQRGIELITATEDDICRYIAQSTSVSSKARQLSSFRRFYRYTLREGLISTDPTARVAMPRGVRASIPNVLSDADVQALLLAPDVTKELGHRDRTMLEVLCVTGVRVSELINLEIGHIKIDAGTIWVESRENYGRLLQLGHSAQIWCAAYLDSARDDILLDSQTCYLFPTRRGTRMTRQAFWYATKRYGRIAGLDKRLSPGTLRNTVARRLFTQGDSLRSVQRQLGHSAPRARSRTV